MEHKIAVVGAGFIGRQHIEAIRRIPGAEVIAVVDENRELAERVAKELRIPGFYDGYRDALNDSKIDIIHNCTPSVCHYEINKLAIEAKKHVYCEKPFTIHRWQAEELVQLADVFAVAAGVNFNYRHNAMIYEMKHIIANRTDRVFSLYGRYFQDWLMYKNDYDWRVDKDKGGASRAVADIGSHCFDLAQFVLGRKIKSVNAFLQNVHSTRIDRDGVEHDASTEDAAIIYATYEDGTPAAFEISQVYAGKKNGLVIGAAGDKLSVEWEQERADRLWIGHRERPNEELVAEPKLLSEAARSLATLPGGHSVAWADALRNAISVFYNAIDRETYRDSKQDYATFADAAEIMCIVDACLESSRTGGSVEIK